MEKERQRTRAQSGRVAARGKSSNVRPSAASVRPSVTPSRPSATPARKSAMPYRTAQPAAPPPYVPHVQPGRYPAPRPRIVVKPQPKPPVRKEEPEEDTFRTALWPKRRETFAQSRTAFLLSLLYVLIYVVCSYLLIYPLNALSARMPFPAADIARAALPAFAGTALCVLITRLRFPDEPAMMWRAFRRFIREVLTVFVAAQALLWGEWEAQLTLARFALTFAAGPLIIGAGVAVLMVYFDWLYIEADE